MVRLRKSRSYRLSLDVLNAALDLGDWERHWGGAEPGRRAWEALGERLTAVTNPPFLPEPYWHYEPGIPAELRGGAGLASDELEARRVAWLAGRASGLLRVDSRGGRR